MTEQKRQWIPIDEAVAIVKEFGAAWPGNFDFKYLSLRIDTRDNHCLMMDRNGKVVDPEAVRTAGIEWRKFLNGERKARGESHG